VRGHIAYCGVPTNGHTLCAFRAQVARWCRALRRRSQAPLGAVGRPAPPQVFEIDVLSCRTCGGRLRLVATIDDPLVIRRILTHLGLPCSLPAPFPARPPPDTAGLPFVYEPA
jgi:hypothetical protein